MNVNQFDVRLSGEEIMSAAMAGVIRRLRALQRQAAPGHKIDDASAPCWQIDIEGALAEYAIAKALDQFWTGISHTGASDVGKIDEVRHTAHPSGNLLLYPKDHDKARYWLVTGQYGQYSVRGWIWGHEGKHEKYWKTSGRSPAYWIPQSALSQTREFDAHR